jgi:hypothetical protein
MSAKSFFALSVSLLFYTILACCKVTSNSDVKFDKVKWDSVGDLQSHPWREDMLNDLITHHQIKGLTYKQLIDSLGEPLSNLEDSGYLPHDSIYYDIVVNYEHHDHKSATYHPQSGTYLAVSFNKDSVAIGFEVVKWKNSLANE